ncbi:MAG: UDP-glucose 4-epimerase [Archaeoglobi archaeon]|nr:UDP-glucose 4-epimerase [Archaeoglobi archaeon]MDK2782230.1 UDP-glucose 4-epimerase [Archaeoglobi archaeon]
MRVLVTGGAGFIGSHLVDALMESGYEVRVVDDLSAGKVENLEKWLSHENFEFLKLDMRDGESLKEVLEDVETVFHLAANPEVRIGEQKPEVLYETNVLITFNLLEAMREKGVRELIFTSSSTVYGDAEVLPTPENYGPLKPISIYGGAKLSAEALISGYSHTFNIKSLVFRLANIIGGRSSHGVIYDFIRKLERDPEKLEILGDGNQRKSYLHVTDTIRGMMHIWKFFRNRDEQFDVYNLGNEDWISVREIAQIVSSEMNLSPEFIFSGGVEGGRGWKGDVKLMLLSIEKAKSTGWSPEMSSREAVRKTAREILEEIKNK